MTTSPRKPRILFFISEDWYFCSHRLPLARAARQKGWDVYLATRVSGQQERIEKEGIRLIPLQRFKRGFQHPVKELKSFFEILNIYRSVRPDIVHQVALKPIVMGTTAAHMTGAKSIINTFAGMGSLFTSNTGKKAFLIKLILLLLRLIFKPRKVSVILQNIEDLNMLVLNKVVRQCQAALIKGSGVNIGEFKVVEKGNHTPVILLASRMLWDKGVGEFVEAAKQVNADRVKARFVLAGSSDNENPTSIPTDQLKKWDESGCVEWWGHQDNMAQVYAKADIVSLPTYYREGLPKVILEACACGKPVIATNTLGCRDIIRHGENGLLVQPRNVGQLVLAMEELIRDPERRKSMGEKGRALIEQEYTEEIITKQTFQLYLNGLSRHADVYH